MKCRQVRFEVLDSRSLLTSFTGDAGAATMNEGTQLVEYTDTAEVETERVHKPFTFTCTLNKAIPLNG